MESVCRITHYQTSFIIDACPPEESAPFILSTLWKWLWHQKERLPMDESLAQIQADFEAGALNRSLAMPRNHIRTLRHELEDRTLWGMEYTERPDPEDSLHASEEGDWLTEVGMTVLRKPESGKPRVVLCVRSSVSPWTANFKDPYPCVPRFIRDLIGKQDTLQAYGADRLFRFLPRPMQITRSKREGERFAAFLRDATRHYPVIVAASLNLEAQDGLTKALEDLGKQLLGKGQVFWFKSDSPAYRGLNAALPEAIRVNPNTLYCFRPVTAPGEDPVREEYGLIKPKSLCESLLRHLNRTQPVLEEGAMTPSDIRRTIRYDLERRIAEQRAQETLAGLSREKQKEIARLEKELDALRHENEVWLNACDKTEADNDELRAQLEETLRQRDALKAKLEAKVGAVERKEGEAQTRLLLGYLAKMADTKRGKLSEQIRVCEPLFADRIVLTRQAYDSMDVAGAKALTFEIVANFLIALYYYLYDTYTGQGSGVSRDDLVKPLGLGCSTESAFTLENKDYGKMRRVRYENREYTCAEHLKETNGKQLRLYFAFMKEHRRFIVCHVGGHLPTMGTKKQGLPRNQ